MAHHRLLPGRTFARYGFTIAALALVFLAASPTQSSGAPPPPPGKSRPPDIAITADISDFDTQGLPADTASDGLGAYQHNVDGVKSLLISGGYNGLQYGDWKFDTYSSATRGVTHSFDQGDAVQPGDPNYTALANPPYWSPPAQTLPTNLQLTCTLVQHEILTMTAGSSFTCPLLNDLVTTDGVAHGLQTAPSQNGFPETTDVQVKCNTADAGGCNDWYIDPIPPGPAVGRLVHRTVIGHKQVQVNDGDFYLRFHIHLTRP